MKNMYSHDPKQPVGSVCWGHCTGRSYHQTQYVGFGTRLVDTVSLASAAPKSKRMFVLLMILASVLLLSACTQKEESAHIKAAQTEAGAAKAYSQKYLDIINDLKKSSIDGSQMATADANWQFIQAMRTHQQAAVMMAYVELKYGKDADARNIAQRSIDIQQAQMSWMDQWLASYTPSQADAPKNIDPLAVNKPSAAHFQSMIQAAQDGTPDKAFVSLMRLHQSQALIMAKQVRLLTSDAQIQALADDIYDTQTAEIKQMQAWLDQHAH